MSLAPSGAVELLERALSYTHAALVRVAPSDLLRPSPCDRWDLDDLLAHMDDALDAFAEGAAGHVDVHVPAPRPMLDARVDALQVKACGLLGAWSSPPRRETTLVGGMPVPTEVVAAAAALEITVHGWDVAATVGPPLPVPDDLARHLLAVAQAFVGAEDRGTRFAAPLPVPPGAPWERRFLAFVGRDLALTRPLVADSGKGRTGAGPAS